MAIVCVARAQTGMRLATSVTNDRGVVLLEAGTILTAQLIARLQKANINSIHVSGPPDHVMLDEMLSQLQKRFERSRGQPHMDILEQVVKEHLEELYGE